MSEYSEDPSQEDLPKSKSQVKREMKALRDLGKQLIALSPSVFKKIPASESLGDAVEAARTFKRQALQRQIGRIGVLLREEDAEAIIEALDDLKKPQQQSVQSFHEIEQWRDQLLNGDQQLLNSLVDEYAADRQHLRQLIRNANKEKELEKPPKSSRQLFQILREMREDNTFD